MARIRTIKPSMFTSMRVSDWPVPVRWAFAGLFTYLDDAGRGLDEPRLIKAAIFALDDPISAKKVDSFLDMMGADDGPVCRYQINGQHYLHIRSWQEHQRINRPRESEIPPCPIHEPDAQGTLDFGDDS